MSTPLIKIGDFEVPTPSSYKGTTADMVDAGRNAQGITIGAVVREDVAKVEAEWNYLTVDAWSSILKKFNSKYGGKFYNDVTFFDQVSGGWVTRTMYVGDRTSTGAFMLDELGRPKGWVKPKLSLVER